MPAYLGSIGPRLDDLALVILPHESGEVPLTEIPANLRPRTVFTGPIVRPVAATALAGMRLRYRVPDGHRLTVVTGGAGGFADQHTFFGSAARAIARTATGPTVGVLVLGYFFDGIADIPGDCGPGLSWRVTRHEPDLPALMRAADLVISQGGYNTLFEARSVGARVVAVPAIRATDDQAARARQMAHDRTDTAVAGAASAEAIARAISSLDLSARRTPPADLPAGRRRAAAAVIELASRAVP